MQIYNKTIDCVYNVNNLKDIKHEPVIQSSQTDNRINFCDEFYIIASNNSEYNKFKNILTLLRDCNFNCKLKQYNFFTVCDPHKLELCLCFNQGTMKNKCLEQLKENMQKNNCSVHLYGRFRL